MSEIYGGIDYVRLKNKVKDAIDESSVATESTLSSIDSKVATESTLSVSYTHLTLPTTERV